MQLVHVFPCLWDPKWSWSLCLYHIKGQLSLHDNGVHDSCFHDSVSHPLQKPQIKTCDISWWSGVGAVSITPILPCYTCSRPISFVQRWWIGNCWWIPQMNYNSQVDVEYLLLIVDWSADQKLVIQENEEDVQSHSCGKIDGNAAFDPRKVAVGFTANPKEDFVWCRMTCSNPRIPWRREVCVNLLCTGHGLHRFARTRLHPMTCSRTPPLQKGECHDDRKWHFAQEN